MLLCMLHKPPHLNLTLRVELISGNKKNSVRWGVGYRPFSYLCLNSSHATYHHITSPEHLSFRYSFTVCSQLTWPTSVLQAANTHTSHMLLYQSYKVGTVDYESLGHAVGGPIWKVWHSHHPRQPQHECTLVARNIRRPRAFIIRCALPRVLALGD